jgi:hypothetical protein
MQPQLQPELLMTRSEARQARRLLHEGLGGNDRRVSATTKVAVAGLAFAVGISALTGGSGEQTERVATADPMAVDHDVELSNNLYGLETISSSRVKFETPGVIGNAPCGPKVDPAEVSRRFAAGEAVVKPSEVKAHFDKDPQVEKGLIDKWDEIGTTELFEFLVKHTKPVNPEILNENGQNSLVREIKAREVAGKITSHIDIQNHECIKETGEIIEVDNITILKKGEQVWKFDISPQILKLMKEKGVKIPDRLIVLQSDSKDVAISIVLERLACNNIIIERDGRITVIESPKPVTTTIEATTSTTQVAPTTTSSSTSSSTTSSSTSSSTTSSSTSSSTTSSSTSSSTTSSSTTPTTRPPTTTTVAPTTTSTTRPSTTSSSTTPTTRPPTTTTVAPTTTVPPTTTTTVGPKKVFCFELDQETGEPTGIKIPVEDEDGDGVVEPSEMPEECKFEEAESPSPTVTTIATPSSTTPAPTTTSPPTTLPRATTSIAPTSTVPPPTAPTSPQGPGDPLPTLPTETVPPTTEAPPTTLPRATTSIAPTSTVPPPTAPNYYQQGPGGLPPAA